MLICIRETKRKRETINWEGKKERERESVYQTNYLSSHSFSFLHVQHPFFSSRSVFFSHSRFSFIHSLSHALSSHSFIHSLSHALSSHSFIHSFIHSHPLSSPPSPHVSRAHRGDGERPETHPLPRPHHTHWGGEMEKKRKRKGKEKEKKRK